MKSFRIVPTIEFYDTFAEFASLVNLTDRDLIFTNEYIFDPVIKNCDLGCQTLFQEKFGAGEPTDAMLDAILAELGKLDFDRLIAVGGGTIIDIAKALVVANPGDDSDALYERMADLEKTHPLFIVPTTCGTGSEVTNIAIFSRLRLGIKLAILHENMYADKAVLISEMLMTLPYPVFATSSIDALVHAIESYLSPKASPLSEMFSVKAIGMLVSGWKAAVAAGGGDAWKDNAAEYLWASAYAGIAFGNAGCAAVHALSYPLGTQYKVPHGQANQLMFADVMRKYKEKQAVGKLQDLEKLLAADLDCLPEEALDALYALMDEVLLRKPLHEFGVKEEELADFARSVMDSQQRLLVNNYCELTVEDMLAIYRQAYA